MNQELLNKARAAKSPEELLQLAHENGMTDLTEESAKGYFEAMHKSGELADEEMDVSAGGCGSLRAHGQIMVSVLNSCGHYRCGDCNSSYTFNKKAVYRDEEALNACNPSVFDPKDKYGHNECCGDFCSDLPHRGPCGVCDNMTIAYDTHEMFCTRGR